MYKVILLLVVAISVSITSCNQAPKVKAAENNTTQEREKEPDESFGDANYNAKALCDCIQEAGFDDSFNASSFQDYEYMNEMENKMEKEVPECALAIFKDIDKEFEELTKKEKKAYTKSFLKACIDTDCSDILLNAVPYDMLSIMIGEMEQSLEYRDKYKDEMDDWEEMERMLQLEMEEDYPEIVPPDDWEDFNP